MTDLVETFASARFGKRAVAPPKTEKRAASPFQAISSYLTMPQLTPTGREIRDTLEQSISEEARLKQRATKATEYARYRLEQAQHAGKLGWLMDILRAAVPGLSVSAAEDAGIEKESADPEKAISGRAFDVAHALAGLGGAGVGGLAGAGMLGGIPGAASLERAVGEGLTKKLLSGAGLGGDLKKLLTTAAARGDLALAAQRDIPYLTRLTEKFSPKWWGRRALDPTAPRTAEAARAGIRGVVEKAIAKQPAKQQEIVKQQLGTFLSQLGRRAAKVKSFATSAAERAAAKGGVAYKLKGKGKIGAIIGAILAMSPFVTARLFKSRRLRAKGGTAAATAAEKAQTALTQAGALKSWRGRQLAQLAGAGSPEGYRLLPME